MGNPINPDDNVPPAFYRAEGVTELVSASRFPDRTADSTSVPADRIGAQRQQRQKMKALGRLAGRLAHDFNNLLTIISSNVQFSLEDLAEKHPARENLQDIDEAAQRAAGLTRQLLTFSQRQVIVSGAIDLNAIVGSMDETLRGSNEGIELAVSLSPDLARVEADGGQVEQILLNLVGNAREAMPKGGRLVIETRNVDLDDTLARDCLDVTPGRYVRLAVSDTGIGMDRETLDQLFEPFFTTKGSTKELGWGLATVYGVVRQSGGGITVESEPGRGTTVTIYLPQVDAPLDRQG